MSPYGRVATLFGGRTIGMVACLGLDGDIERVPNCLGIEVFLRGYGWVHGRSYVMCYQCQGLCLVCLVHVTMFSEGISVH